MRKLKIKATPLAIDVPLTEEDLNILGHKPQPSGKPDIGETERAKMEQQVYKAQERIIKDKYGEDCANTANYGWAVEEDADGVAVATKVYGTKDGCMILDTTFYLSEKGMKHEWERY